LFVPLATIQLSNSTLTAVAIGALALSLLALGYAFALGRRSRGARDLDVPFDDDRFGAVAQSQGRAIQRLEGAVIQLADGERRLGEALRSSIRRIGLVRFDAFEDMGGRLSFSAALLDENGDGIVITSINGRQDTRCYAKTVLRGTSVHNLSDEEDQAIREAMTGRREVAQAR
jgi:Protein of unknown function (DUF4446)